MRELQNDPLLRARIESKEALRAQQVLENRRASVEVIADLRDAGFKVNWIADLFGQRMNYRAAIPLLLEWLPKINNTDVKQDIIRALSVKWAKPQAAPLLIKEFRAAHDPTGLGIRWTIANALAVVADDSVYDEIVKLALDRSFGRGREMLALAFANMRSPDAVKVLVRLLEDDEMAGHAILALGKVRAADARHKIEPFLEHPKAWVRKEAKKALRRIDSSPSK